MDEEVFTLLEREVHKATMVQNSKHSAALVYRGKVISVGVNKRKTHPLQKKYSSHCEKLFLHAEVDSIVKCINKHGTEVLKKSDIYVLRLSKGGSITNSKPCSGCMKAIKAFGIRNVYWTKGD